ncbi:MAG TPA: M28 family metallopeptidase [Pyrinomonadaceae bacterium]|nr:M28 family metallopeptidase [Pyrinomonadaceae bacterium]
MKHVRSPIALTIIFLLNSFQSFSFAQTIDGFSQSKSQDERRIEEQFRAVPQGSSAREHLRRLTEQPHIAGTPEDYATAVYVRDQMRSFGLPAELKEYQVWLNYPKSDPIVELIAPRREKLSVREAVVKDDPTSANPKITPLFNGYAASGDVTAPLVYANYGLPPDYDALAKAGVDVKGKIVIVRYGNSFRGVKAKVAQDHGAIGCIIYSDPADDGFAQGDVYPKGPWRPVASGQRGSVQFLFQYPGDPLTPGKPAIPGTPRISLEEAYQDIPRIPVQPLAYDEARKLIEPLKGPARPRGFQGAFPFAYHVGGTNDVRIHLKTDMDYASRTLWDVVARIDGNEESDRWIVLGNHRDAWVFGAVDPNSGTATMLEAARGFGALLKQGWKPRRTIMLCSWDGEEYGLIGSTEWAEENAAELQQKAVAYLNVDVAVTGPNYGASAVPSLWKLIRASTRDVKDPKTGQTIYQAWTDRAREQRNELDSDYDSEARIAPLGSGSDYTPFLQHLGIASTDMGFGGDYGVYHSAYDSFYWMTHFGDPDFAYHVAAAQLWGTMALRLADAPALGFDYTDYASQIREYFNESMKLARRRHLDKAIDEKAIYEALKDFTDEAARLESERQRLASDEKASSPRLRRLNDALMSAERAFIDERGLLGRPWYRHQIYAPGIFTGYAAQPLTDFRQALDDRNSTHVKDGLDRVVAAIKRATEVLRKGRE